MEGALMGLGNWRLGKKATATVMLSPIPLTQVFDRSNVSVGRSVPWGRQVVFIDKFRIMMVYTDAHEFPLFNTRNNAATSTHLTCRRASAALPLSDGNGDRKAAFEDGGGECSKWLTGCTRGAFYGRQLNVPYRESALMCLQWGMF